MFHCHSFAVFTALMILGMYGDALLKAKRYSALKSMSFEKKTEELNVEIQFKKNLNYIVPVGFESRVTLFH